MGKRNGNLTLEVVFHTLLHNKSVILTIDVLTLVLILYFLYKGNNWICYFIIGILSLKLVIMVTCTIVLYSKKCKQRKISRKNK